MVQPVQKLQCVTATINLSLLHTPGPRGSLQDNSQRPTHHVVDRKLTSVAKRYRISIHVLIRPLETRMG